jgi:RecB family exonuclease
MNGNGHQPLTLSSLLEKSIAWVERIKALRPGPEPRRKSPRALAAVAEVIADAEEPAPIIEQPAEVLSPSQCNCFLECQVKWYYKYCVRLAEPHNGSRLLGIAVDDALSENFRAKARKGESLPEAEVHEAFSASFGSGIAEAELLRDESADDLADSGRALCTRYLEDLAPLVTPALIDDTPAVQMPVEGEVGGVPVRGYVDVLDVDGSIIDLKTSKRRPAGISADYRLQLATYDRLAGVGARQGQLHYMIRTKRIQTLRLTAKVTEADDRLVEAIYPAAQEAMRSGLYLPRRTSNLCSRKYCAFWSRCESDFGGEVKE